MQKTVAVNEAGLRIGEDHPNAKLTDGEVEMIRQLFLVYSVFILSGYNSTT